MTPTRRRLGVTAPARRALTLVRGPSRTRFGSPLTRSFFWIADVGEHLALHLCTPVPAG